MDAYRPYPTAKDLELAIKEIQPDYWENNKLLSFVSALKNPKIEDGSIQDVNRNVVAFSSKFKKHVLPPLDNDLLVAKLLTTAEWKSAQGVEWVPGVTAPTAPKGTAFHIVPEEYAGHITKVDSESCAQCHAHTGFNVRLFDQNRGWYGRVRGNDGIFTFHPIDPSAISYDGTNKAIVLRQAYVKAGIVEMYDKAKHSGELYSQLKK